MSRKHIKRDPIMLIEPTPFYAALIRDWLLDMGFSDVHTFSNPDTAKIHLQETKYMALICEIKLEGTTGLKIAHDLRHTPNAINRLIPIIILDARATNKRVSAARDVGATEFVCKPLSRKAFAEHFEIATNTNRSFIKAHRFFGPDRRRRANDWDGDDRRRLKPKRANIKSDGTIESPV